jgi:hypothetical protein
MNTLTVRIRLDVEDPTSGAKATSRDRFFLSIRPAMTHGSGTCLFALLIVVAGIENDRHIGIPSNTDSTPRLP